MKISVKTLKGSHFSIDVNPSDAVTTVKKQIEDLQGKEVFPSAQQILIYQGKVLKDETTLEENGVAENSFVVIMITKSKAPVAVPSSASTSTSTSTSVASSVQVRPETPLPAPAPSPAPLAVGTTASTMEASATVDIATNRALGDVYGQAASNFVAGSNLQETFQQILAMGGGAWDHDSVARALRAAFNNPERAVEYLFNGIPESAEIAQGPPATATTTTAVPPVPRAGPNAAPLDLFPQGMPAATGAAAPAAASAGGLEFLLNNPQFQAIRAMVQANPQILQPLLQELERQNPQLFQMINENHGDFHRLIGEPVGSENAMLGQMAGLVPQAVDLTPQERAAQEGARLGQLAGVMPEVFDLTSQEREAVERLEAMGFNRALVIEAFFACDRNEQLAANYLLEHAGEQYD